MSICQSAWWSNSEIGTAVASIFFVSNNIRQGVGCMEAVVVKRDKGTGLVTHFFGSSIPGKTLLSG
ncbi:hypothetical protein [Desulfosporosinus sp.]|uniref:hypothetical protein n=1 Tax=Desulfosporosinus sp. TaxID=157907 RepID=UPI00261E498F|nr:hypothetical protein [Desulfosporosinus sp.]